jgi:phosphoglycolate phosphatase-like HAD superfamily hydrolase
MPLDPSRIQAILFDVDGTLADTDDAFIQRAGKLMRRLNFLFPQRDPTNFLRWSLMVSETPLNLLMGVPDWLGVDDELARLYEWLTRRRERGAPAHPPKGVPGSVGAAADALMTPGEPPETSGHFILMTGVAALLERLAERYPLAVVTARGERAAVAFLEQFGLRQHFKAIASAQTAPHTKPYPDPVVWAARTLGVPVEHCLMVGDTTVDILAGKRAGAQTVGVLCGFGERGELERTGANLILDTTAELGPHLLEADARE